MSNKNLDITNIENELSNIISLAKEDIEKPVITNEEFDLNKELDKIVGLESVKERIQDLYAYSLVDKKEETWA